MIKNIPNKYDLTLILQTIDKNHKGKYDFFYLPIDFRVLKSLRKNNPFRTNAMLDMLSLTSLNLNI
jgi:RNA recognition motif 2.